MHRGACAEERRDELIEWLRDRCIDGDFWVMRDEKGPFGLAHFERANSEIITVVVRDGMERKGVATELVRAIQAKENFLKGIPVTPGADMPSGLCLIIAKG